MSSSFTSFSYSLKDRLSRALDQIQMNNGSAPGSPKSSPFRRSSENRASDIGTLYAKDLLPYPNGSLERTEEFLLRVVEILFDHIRKTNDRSCKILDFHHPEQLKEILDFEIPDEPQNLDQLLVDCKDTLKYQVKTGHPRFFNQLSTGLDLVCMAGEWLTATANSNMFTYEISPVFVLMEQITLRKMLDIVGYPNGDGIFAPGGTISNLYAMHAARYKRFPEIKTKGMHSVPNLAIFTSEHSHYSIKGAGSIMGLGTDNVILVKCDRAGRMIPSELEKEVLEAKRRGFCPFFTSATAGTTVYGAFDPIHPIADICQKYGMWFHVDAAWGGGALLSNKYRGRMDGIERADSVTWNPHKLMGALLQCSTVLLKEDGLLFSCNQMCADYLYQQDKHYEVSYDTGDRAIQCGRHVDVFKLWLMWRAKGTKGFEKHIDWLFELTQYLVDKIKERDDFELILEPECTNVCFWYVPPSCRNMPQGPERQKKLGVLTAKIKGKMMENGTLMIGYQPLGDIPNFFRMIFSNAAVTKEDVDFLIEEIDRLGRQF